MTRKAREATELKSMALLQEINRGKCCVKALERQAQVQIIRQKTRRLHKLKMLALFMKLDIRKAFDIVN
jgi:hypothetical protein